MFVETCLISATGHPKIALFLGFVLCATVLLHRLDLFHFRCRRPGPRLGQGMVPSIHLGFSKTMNSADLTLSVVVLSYVLWKTFLCRSNVVATAFDSGLLGRILPHILSVFSYHSVTASLPPGQKARRKIKKCTMVSDCDWTGDLCLSAVDPWAKEQVKISRSCM